MTETDEPNPSSENYSDHHEPGLYEFRVRGHLSEEWRAWFEGLTLTLEENGETLITGPVVDQAALHGLLRKVRDLGVTLISVVRVEGGQEDTPDDKH